MFARCRPLLPCEEESCNALAAASGDGARPLRSPVTVDTEASEVWVKDCRGYDTDQRLKFEYDCAFGAEASQEAVFEQVRPLVTSFLDGFDVCIFAYGQTGSGKVRFPASDGGDITPPSPLTSELPAHIASISADIHDGGHPRSAGH